MKEILKKKEKTQGTKDTEKAAKKESKIAKVQEIKDIIEKIRFFNKKYYLENQSVVSDHVYDVLLQKAHTLYKEHSDDIPESLTSSLNFSVEDSFLNLYDHTQKMLSLNNVYNEDQFKDFFDNAKKKLNIKNINLVAEHKIDGLSLSLVYNNGILCHALTRGDGITGEDVLHNVHSMGSVLPFLSKEYSKGEVIIRGEVYIKREDFRYLQEETESLYSNPRNAASGLLRSKKKSLYVSFLFFSAYYFSSDTISIVEEFEKINILQSLGFMCPKSCIMRNYADCINFYNETLKERNILSYDIDGVVYKINDANYQKILSSSATAPRWCIAYKCPAPSCASVLRDIFFSVGRNGVITPVGYIKPVCINGVRIQKASLHNFQNIEEKDLAIGDTVLVERAGDVIPYISRNVQKSSVRKKISIPQNCSCFLKTRVCRMLSLDGLGGAYYCCSGRTMCPYQQYGNLVHFTSRDVFNIKGLGSEVIRFLMKKGWVRYPHHFFSLSRHRDEWISERGFGEKNVGLVLENIEKKRAVSLNIFLYSLGIHGLGKHLSNTISSYFGSWERLYQTINSSHMYKSFLSIDGIGESVVASISNFFSHWKIRRNTFLLLKQITIIDSEPIQKMHNETVVFSGTFKQYTRTDLQNMAQKNGFKYNSSVSKKTHFLVLGEKGGKKKEDALAHNVTIFSLDQWLNYLTTKRKD